MRNNKITPSNGTFSDNTQDGNPGTRTPMIAKPAPRIHRCQKCDQMITSRTEPNKHKSAVFISRRTNDIDGPRISIPGWRVPRGSLCRLPRNYFIARQNIRIHETEPSVVAARIARSLQRLSIKAVFDEFEATARAETIDRVVFEIRLFQAEKNELHSDSTVIVEIQRFDGCPLSFHKYCQSILQAANGRDDLDYGEKISGKHHYPHFENGGLNKQEYSGQEDFPSHVLSAIKTAHFLLKENRIDANVLGLESLRFLTDPSSSTSSISASILASKEILTHATIGGEYICGVIFSLLKNGAGPAPTRGGEEDISGDGCYNDLRYSHTNILRYHALVIMANILCVVDGDRNDNDNELGIIMERRPWLSGELVCILIKELHQAKSNPHNSYHAARSLNVLVRVSGVAREKALELRAPDVVHYSRYVGRCSHALLAGASERVMAALDVN